jgi:hypothetical protein
MFLILFIFYLTLLICLILLLQAACVALKPQKISTGAADGLWYVYKEVILNYASNFNGYFWNPIIKQAVVTATLVSFLSFYNKIVDEYLILGHDRFLPRL